MTQGEYLAVMGSNPSWFNGDRTADGGANYGVDLSRPVEMLGPSSRRKPLAISEVMVPPGPRNDGRNLEFMEFNNSQPWFQHRCTRRNR